MFNSGHLLSKINAYLVMKYNLVVLSKVSYHYSHIFFPVLGAFVCYYLVPNCFSLVNISDFRLLNPESISSIIAFPTTVNQMLATVVISLIYVESISFALRQNQLVIYIVLSLND
jgi:hypothetical protein